MPNDETQPALKPDLELRVTIDARSLSARSRRCSGAIRNTARSPRRTGLGKLCPCLETIRRHNEVFTARGSDSRRCSGWWCGPDRTGLQDARGVPTPGGVVQNAGAYGIACHKPGRGPRYGEATMRGRSGDICHGEAKTRFDRRRAGERQVEHPARSCIRRPDWPRQGGRAGRDRPFRLDLGRRPGPANIVSANLGTCRGPQPQSGHTCGRNRGGRQWWR